VWAAGAIGLYAVVGFFVLPPIARTQIEKRGGLLLHRVVSVTRVRFDPFRLAAVVEGLDVKDRDGAELLHVDRLSADFQVSGIFRRAFRFREIVLTGPHAVARIAADGRLSIADLFEAGASESSVPQPTRLPRVLIDRLAVQAGRAEFVNESRSPPFSEALGPLDLEVHELTTIPAESGDHTITLGLEGGARVHWSGRQTVDPLRFDGKIEITGIPLPHLYDYLGAESPLILRAGTADLECTYDIHKGANERLALKVSGADVTVRDLAMRPRGGGEDWLTLPLLELRGAEVAWPEAHAAVREIRATGPHVLAWLEKDGAVNWQEGWAAPAASDAPPWSAKIDRVEIVKASAHVEDRSIQPNVVFELAEADLTVENVTTDKSARMPVHVSARLCDLGELHAAGLVAADPPTADFDMKLTGLPLKPFNPYAIHEPWAEIRGGTAGADGTLHFGADAPRIRFDGGLEVKDLQVAGGGVDRIVACKKVKAKGAHVTIFPEKIHVVNLDAEGAFVNLDIDREGNINLKKIFSAAPAAPPPPSEPLALDIRSIAIHEASADYTDESLILPFGTRIHSINGTIKDVSTTAAAPARLGLEGRIGDTGYFKSDGTLRIAAPFASSDIGVIFRGVHMPDLTPYAAQFAGYSIEKGSLDVDVRYRIKDGRLVGDHRVVAKDLTLGPKVAGAKSPGLPVRLAIALLKDKDGRIDLEVPVEGTIDSPDFNYKSVFWQAFKTILANIAAAPFRAIAGLGGAHQDDLELVGFPAGRSELTAPEREKLAKVGAELAQKPDFSLAVEGRYDPVADVEAIRRIRLDERIDFKRESAGTPESILEALYAESFSTDRLDNERKKYPSDAGAFYDAVRSQLLAAEDVPDNELHELARARAAAIAAGLCGAGGLDPQRVKALDPAPVKRKKQGSELVASEMTLSAGD
jgi:uncharacterized protein involved in outer membrane biogenesis